MQQEQRIGSAVACISGHTFLIFLWSFDEILDSFHVCSIHLA
jgi:hypothetical protein